MTGTLAMARNIRDGDRKILEALAEASDTCSELQPLIAFYEAVYRLQFSARPALLPDLHLPSAEECRQRMHAGEILLTFDRIQLRDAEVRSPGTPILVRHRRWESRLGVAGSTARHRRADRPRP